MSLLLTFKFINGFLTHNSLDQGSRKATKYSRKALALVFFKASIAVLYYFALCLTLTVIVLVL